MARGFSTTSEQVRARALHGERSAFAIACMRPRSRDPPHLTPPLPLPRSCCGSNAYLASALPFPCFCSILCREGVLVVCPIGYVKIAM